MKPDPNAAKRAEVMLKLTQVMAALANKKKIKP